MNKKTLPLLELKINPKKGSLVSAISIVETPAISSNFIAFSKDEPTRLVFAANDERMELLGAAMIPGLPMYRNTKEIGEYMAVFEAETIREIAQVFAENGFFKNMNVDHSDKSAGSYVFQSYIVDEAKGVFAPKDVDAPNGSWIVGVKVNDLETWKNIKAGKSNGFSVEGFFDLFDTSIELELEFERLINEYFSEKMGCLMFYPDIYDLEQWKAKQLELAPNALENETEPHITILYGFTDFPELIDGLKLFIQEALNICPLNINFGSISKFTNPEQDVVKIDIIDCNGTLTHLNYVLAETFKIVSNFDEYKPHMTIAYTEPRPEVAFSSEIARPWQFGFDYLNKGKIVYSDAMGNKTEILVVK